MVNPLRGFISDEGRLFQSLDSQGEGIDVCEGRGILITTFDHIFGRTEEITIAGDVVSLDKKSVEEFFARNEALFEGLELREMTLTQKLLSLLKRNKKLPRNLVEEEAIGGEEARREVIGVKPDFVRLVKALEKNAFKVSQLLDLIKEKEKEGFLRFDREEIFRKIIEENKGRLEELQDTVGDEKVRRLTKILIKNIRDKLFPSEE